MRYQRSPVACTLVAVLFIGSVEVGSAQERPSDFQGRFHYDAPPVELPSNNAPQDQPSLQVQERPRNPLQELLVSPAEAAPTPTAREQSSSRQPDSTEIAQGSVDNAVRSRTVSSKPLMVGRAAYYEHPGRTASGQVFNPDKHTAAHKTLALGTRLRVVNLRNRKSVIVQVTDRAPAAMKFAIDLSRGSAKSIGITKREGTAMVALYKVY